MYGVINIIIININNTFIFFSVKARRQIGFISICHIDVYVCGHTSIGTIVGYDVNVKPNGFDIRVEFELVSGLHGQQTALPNAHRATARVQ